VTDGADIGRRKKARDIAETMESGLLMNGTFNARALAKLIHERIPQMDAAAWEAFFEKYMPGRKLKPPSDDCLPLILGHLCQRLAEVEASRRDPVPDVA